jgi:hypothetical protein
VQGAEPDPIGASAAESDDLDEVVAALGDQQRTLPTPASGSGSGSGSDHHAPRRPSDGDLPDGGPVGLNPDAFQAVMPRLEEDFTANVAC